MTVNCCFRLSANWFRHLNGVIDYCSHIHGLDLQLNFPLGDPRHIEQIVNNAGQPWIVSLIGFPLRVFH